MAYLSSAHHLCVLRRWLYLEWTGCAWMRSTERYAANATPAAAAHVRFKHSTPADLCCCNCCAIHQDFCAASTSLLVVYDCEHPTHIFHSILPELVLRTMQVGYETLNQMLGCTSAYPAKRIVRVGGPDDRCARRCEARYETPLMVHSWLDLLVCYTTP
jgi:hypothetical protein